MALHSHLDSQEIPTHLHTTTVAIATSNINAFVACSGTLRLFAFTFIVYSTERDRHFAELDCLYSHSQLHLVKKSQLPLI